MPKVLVPIADGVEEIEAVTVVDVLRRAEVEVICAGLTEKPVTASRKVKFVPDTSLEEVKDETFDMAQRQKWVTAICAAPTLLAAYGLLEGRKATSHPSRRNQTALGKAHYQEQRVVQDGHIITSRGPGTAMEFALKLVEVLCGREKVGELKEAMVVKE